MTKNNKYSYMEIVTKYFTNRGIYKNSKDVIKYSFNNRYIETWRGMFMYDNSTPNSIDRMIGNFYIESDEGNFERNILIIKTAIKYLQENYNIPDEYFNFFITNRSIWCEIPYKVFGILPQAELNKVYKDMATEINENITKTLKINKALDLSIYKWNGLIHALGSYLPNSKRWVSKFDMWHLKHNDFNNIEEFLNIKFDNCSEFSQINTINECQKWFKKLYNKKNFEELENPSLLKLDTRKENGIKSEKIIDLIRELPLEEGNRNNTIYAYALALKNSNKDIDKEISTWVKNKNNNYYDSNENEIHRTIYSAINGNNNFSYKQAQEILGLDFSDLYNKKYKNTFIIPRSFIDILNKNKCNWNCYKLLIQIIHSEQILDSNFTYNLKGEKYKKNIIAYFEKLQKIGLIFYTQKEDIITTNLIEQPYEIYKNHIIIPNMFVEGNIFKNLGKEFIILSEILRSSYIGKYDIHMSNIKLTTICKNLSLKFITVFKVINKLKKLQILCGKYITMGNKEVCIFIRNILINKNKKKSCSFFNLVNKMIYSIKNKITKTLDLSICLEENDKTVFGELII